MTSITCCALLALKSKEFEIAGEHRDVALAEIGDHFRRVLQRREAEERRRRNPAQRPFHRAEALFDFFLALVLGQLLVGQRRVRPGVAADGVAGRINLLQDFRIISGVLADDEENAGGAFVRQRLKDRRRVDRPGAVVEGQHHFLVAQEVELFEMLKAEPRSARGVDLDSTADTERVRVGAGGSRGVARWLRRVPVRRPLPERRQPEEQRRLWRPAVFATMPRRMRARKLRPQKPDLLQYAWCFP